MATKITSDNLAPTLATAIVQGGGPKITSVVVTDDSFNPIDDTAANISGGYIKIIGTGFSNGCQVTIGNIPASSVIFVSSTELRVGISARPAGSYPVYVTNTDGGTGTRINGITYSPHPIWATGSSLAGQVTGANFNLNLSASSDSNVVYTLAPGSSLPAGLTLFANGLISGNIVVGSATTFNFDIIAIDQENQEISRSFSLPVVVSDVDITPAFGANTSWIFLSQGDLYLDTPNIYQLTFSTEGTYNFKMWGAGGGDSGGSTGDGGGGGYTTGNINITSGNIYSLVVGERGYYMYLYHNNTSLNDFQATNYGGGGRTAQSSGSGGGYSGIFRGSNVNQSAALLIAGGGGGGGQAGAVNVGGGHGGGTAGASGGQYIWVAGGGGSQSAGGAGPQANPGAALRGGDSLTGSDLPGGAGGGGYFGGGAARGGSGHSASGGGGGSGFVSPVVPGGVTVAGSGATAGNSSAPQRGTAGSGGVNGHGGPGRIVISKIA
jgi:hypothetical protein